MRSKLWTIEQRIEREREEGDDREEKERITKSPYILGDLPVMDGLIKT